MSPHGRRSIPHSVKKDCIRYDGNRNDSAHGYLPLGAKIVLYVTESGDEKLKPECLLSMETLRPIRTLCASLQLQDS
jgi:hypothetical protein